MRFSRGAPANRARFDVLVPVESGDLDPDRRISACQEARWSASSCPDLDRCTLVRERCSRRSDIVNAETDVMESVAMLVEPVDEGTL